MSLIGDWIRVFKGPDTYSTLRNVKNQGIDSANAGLLSDQGTSRQATQKSLADFTSEYLAAQPQRQAQTAQEVGAIDRYYTGDFDRMLGAIRNNRAAAMRTAGDRAIGYADRARQSASMLRPGGSSSYFDRQALQQTGDIEARIALDQADQEKADYLAAENARMTLAGRRGQLGDATTGRLLYPAAVGRAANAELTNNLGRITNIDQANTFYGLQKNRDDLDKAADIADLTDRTIMTLASMYFGGVGGMAGMAGGAAGGGGGAGGGVAGGAGGVAGGVAGGAGGIMSMIGKMGGGMGGGSGGGSGGGDTSEGTTMWSNPSTGGMGDFAGETGPTQSAGGWNPYNWNTNNWLGAAKGLYGRADGGPVMPGTPYVMGERGPEMVIPATPGAGSGTMAGANTMAGSQIVAVGGMGSDSNNGFFKFVGPTAPGQVQNIPLRGTGHGLAGTGVGEAKSRIRNAIDRNIAKGVPSLVLGHSFGGLLTHSISPDYANNPLVDFLHIDPPGGQQWNLGPGAGLLSPSANLIINASKNGVDTSPNMINWTGGRAGIGTYPAHSPWDNPDYPGNSERMTNLLNLINKRYNKLTGIGDPPDAISAPATPITRTIPARAYGGDVSEGQPYVVGEHGPEVVIPDEPGFVIPNEKTLANNPALKASIIQQLLQQRRRSAVANDVGPRPTATPVGDSFGAVQAAVDRGTAIISAQADERFRRANLMEQQANRDRQEASAMKQRLAEWQEQMRQSKENSATQKAQFNTSIGMQQQQIDINRDRDTQSDWRRQAQDVDRSRDFATRQQEQANSAEFTEAWQAIGQGLIRDPKDLAHFRSLTPDQSARLAGYIQAGRTADSEQDQAVMSMVAPMASEIRTKRMELAKDALKNEEDKAKWYYNSSNKDTIAQLKQAIATGNGLPLMPEAAWRTYLERLAKNPKLSQLVRIDDATQTITPITKGTAPMAPAAPATPATTPAEAGPGYDFGRMSDQTDIGARPQTTAPTGSLLERAGIPSVGTQPTRRYRFDPAIGDYVTVQ